MDMSEVLQVFFTESKELIDQFEQNILLIENQNYIHDDELINAMFRSAHTIKGSAGVVGLDYIVNFTHYVETAIDLIRDGKLIITKDLIQVLLESNDFLKTLIEYAENETAPTVETEKCGAKIIEKLRPFVNLDSDERINESSDVLAPASISNDSDEKIHLHIVLHKNLFRDGFDLFSIASFIRSQVEGFNCHIHTNNVPSLDLTNSCDELESCYLAVDFYFPLESKEIVDNAISFIKEDCTFYTFVNHNDYLNFFETLNEKDHQYYQSVWPQLTFEKDLPITSTQLVDQDKNILTEDSSASSPSIQSKIKKRDDRLMRVHAYRLDDLVNQLGELVIATASLQEQSIHLNNDSLLESVQEVQSLVDELQSSALQLRMVQIGETFNRFTRVVRDTAVDLGKNVNLQIVGADTELDKSMVEKISDPLMHLVRNALDHGLEGPDERIAAGKTAEGSLVLSAYHDSGSIVIEIRDDGRGINRQKVFQKALEKKIVTADMALNDHEIDNLIFAPGFSTADAVSNLSGRGVGMDVVKRNIESLRGTVTIESSPGLGSTFQLRLPLTLAIIDGFMVKVANSNFVVPLDLITECIELPQQDITNNLVGHLRLRDEVLPFIYLNRVFDLEEIHLDRKSIVVVKYGQYKAGIVVDGLLGEFQTVIKPLGKIFESMQGISGSSILGSGDIALILDVPKLIALHAS